MNNILVLTGYCAAGKDTVQNILVDRFGYTPLVSTTTRPIRNGEVEDVNYHFVSDEYFKKQIQDNNLIEYREYHTEIDNTPQIWYYGVEKKEIEQKPENSKIVVVLDSTGYKEFVKTYGREQITLIWVDADLKLRKLRCKKRGDYNQQEFKKRLSDDIKRFKGIANEADIVIDNNLTSLGELTAKIRDTVSLIEG